MVSVMKKLTMFNVIMMAEIVVQILIWLIMASVMMRQTILSVIMMVETVVDLIFPKVTMPFSLKNVEAQMIMGGTLRTLNSRVRGSNPITGSIY
jgi:hypothetical protein